MEERGWEDGGVGEPSACLVPWIQPDNTRISVNNPENNLKTGTTNSTTKCREEATWKRIGRSETY